MLPVPNLALPERDGLPDEVAYLRAAHPAAGWRAHASFGELARFWLHVHETLRHEAHGLARLTAALQSDALDRQAFAAAFVPRMNAFLQHLHAHHTIEDDAYFPKFRSLDPRAPRGFDLLEADHRLIDEALQASVDKARDLLAALAPAAGDSRPRLDAYAAEADRLKGLLVRHLADEEDLVIPAMLEHGERAVA